MKHKFYSVCYFILASILAAGCLSGCKTTSATPEPESPVVQSTQKTYSEFTLKTILMFENDAETKALLEKSIALCKAQNPDKATNPVQSLEDFYDFVEWSTKCMPWNIAPQPEGGRNLYNSIDQSLNYFYWIIEQPLEELAGRDYYNNTLQYHEPIRSWMIDYTRKWGEFLSTPESWNEEYLATAVANEEFGLSKGWYEDASNWKTFNDFFARHLKDASQRPVASPEDNSVLVSPADSHPQGIWKIDENNELVPKEGVLVKSRRYNAIDELLGPDSAYKDAFKNGIMTHTFLDVNDYHRYHTPISGKIVELALIPGDEAVGGTVVYDPENVKYVLQCDTPDWQAIETRSRMIIENEEYGLVAYMPIGMSQVNSCNWLNSLKVGDTIKKGDEVGYFLFGGSDIVMIFQEGVKLDITVPQNNGSYAHVNQGEEYGRLSK